MEPADRQKVIDCLFDMENSAVLAELEGGKRLLSELSSISGIPEARILSNLSCLVEYGILTVISQDDATYLSADHAKLSELVESDGNFDAAIDGLTKMDSFLN